ncbi:MAG: hypothetical protein R3B09_28860 [Nannocystaceae bacterium]
MSFFKLERLTIRAWKRRSRAGISLDKFTVQYNPSSLQMSHQNVFESLQGINTSGREARYSHSRPETLAVDLVIDGSGVDDFALTRMVGLGTKSVTDQVAAFLKLCFYMEGSIHEPKYLRLSWGDGVLGDFDCRLDHVDIHYVSFDRDGKPLRAELKASFVADVEDKKRARRDGKSSPDLTHTRVVRAGDTLPLLCEEIYGSPVHHLRIARVNGLDNPRALEPGRALIFPPLAQ